MKANELMIGDWVFAYGHPRQVEIVYNERIQANCIELSEDNFEPIPLTAEILEKNGWRSRMNGSGEFYLKKPLIDAAIVTKTIMGFQMNHGPFSGLSIHYVHELQNALRLCGIEKEIEL